jgi:hypothetical protein
VGVGFKRAGSLLLLIVALSLVPQAASAKKVSSRCKNGGLAPSATQFPVELAGALEPSVLSSYGVLRRAQRPSDLLPPVNSAATEVESGLSGYYASEIRQVARLPNGQRFVLVPGLPRAIGVVDESCVPASLRKVVEEQQKKAAEPRYCVVEVPSRGPFSGGECEPFADASQSPEIFGLSLFGVGQTVALLVPDGVASVRVTGPGKESVTSPVSENAYLYTPTPHDVKLAAHVFHAVFTEHEPKHPTKAQRRRALHRFERALREVVTRTKPSKVEWLDATGKVLKTVRRPPGAGAGGFLGAGLIRLIG